MMSSHLKLGGECNRVGLSDRNDYSNLEYRIVIERHIRYRFDIREGYSNIFE